MRMKKRYEGKIYTLKSGIDVIVIDDSGGYHNVIVETMDEHKARIKCEITQLTRGTLGTPYQRVVAGVGYIGEGPYVPRPKGQAKSTSYVYWSNMMTRVYRYDYAAYRGCSIDPRWHNFQVFSEWFYSQIGNDKSWDIDKDLFKPKHSRIYSPDCCIMVPSWLNGFAVGIYKKNGCYPGVYYKKEDKKYRAQLSIPKEMTSSKKKARVCLGAYKDEYEAHMVYVDAKMKLLREMIDYYSGTEESVNHLKDRILSDFKIHPIKQKD